RLRSNSSDRRLMNSMPKMNSLNSLASILPRRMSAALKRKPSSWERVIFSCFMNNSLSWILGRVVCPASVQTVHRLLFDPHIDVSAREAPCPSDLKGRDLLGCCQAIDRSLTYLQVGS